MRTLYRAGSNILRRDHAHGLLYNPQGLPDGVGLRAENAEGKRYISGLSVRFDAWYLLFRFGQMSVYERVAPGAFDKTLAEDGGRLLSMFNHDPNFVLGSAQAGTLRSHADQIGLHYRTEIDEENPLAMAAYSAVRRGDVRGASIAFEVVRDLWEVDREKNERRVTIMEARLYEHGPVVMPASPTTTAEAERSGEQFSDAEVRSVALRLRDGAQLTARERAVLEYCPAGIEAALGLGDNQPADGNPAVGAEEEMLRTRFVFSAAAGRG